MCTYNATTDSINPFQVVIMYENHIAVGCALDRLRKEGHNMQHWDLPRRYGREVSGDDPGYLRYQRKVEQNSSTLWPRALTQVPSLARGRNILLNLERHGHPLPDALAISDGGKRHETLG
jgi:hypothetical protein